MLIVSKKYFSLKNSQSNIKQLFKSFNLEKGGDRSAGHDERRDGLILIGL